MADVRSLEYPTLKVQNIMLLAYKDIMFCMYSPVQNYVIYHIYFCIIILLAPNLYTILRMCHKWVTILSLNIYMISF